MHAPARKRTEPKITRSSAGQRIRVAGRRERGWRTAWRRHGEHGVVEVASAPGREHRVTTINTCTRCCAGAKDVEFEKCYSARLSLNDMEGNASPRGCHVCGFRPRLLARVRACPISSGRLQNTETALLPLFIPLSSDSPLSPRFSSGYCRAIPVVRTPSSTIPYPLVFVVFKQVKLLRSSFDLGIFEKF